MNSETTTSTKSQSKVASPDLAASKNGDVVVAASSSSSSQENQILLEKLYATRLPWGVIREKLSPVATSTSNQILNVNTTTAQVNDASASLGGLNQLLINIDFANIEKKRPGEYLMNLLMFNFVQVGSKKLEQIVSGDKRV